MGSSEANKSASAEAEKPPSKPPSAAPSEKQKSKPPSAAPSEKQKSKPPSAASQKPASRASQKPESKPASPAAEQQPSKPPSAASQKPPSKAPSRASQKPPSQPPSPVPEKPPSKAPSVVSEKAPSVVSKQRSKGSRQSKRSKQGTPSLQTANHPFPRKNNTHLGHRSPTRQSLPEKTPRSQSLPVKGPSPSTAPPPSPPHREPSAAPSIGVPLAAGTPVPGTVTPLSSVKLDPLGSMISIGTLATLARGPTMGSTDSLNIPDPLEQPGMLVSSHRFLDPVTDEQPAPLPELPRDRYFGSATSLRSKKSLKPLPEIKEVKEPKHPRNKYIQKKLSELEELNKKIRDGPWNKDYGLSPRKPDIEIMGPYTLDDVKYDKDDPPARIITTPENPQDIVSVIKSRFQLPPAWDPETGQIKEEIARAAAVMATATADPRESRQNPDPIGPSVCDCCEDMNDHNRHMADLERNDPRPRVVQAKKLEQQLGWGTVQSMGYYRSDSPTLIPVSTYMDRDLASEELLKAGVAESMVNKLKTIAKPHAVSASQVPWPFYAHDMTSTNDLNAYLDTGLPLTTDALLTVNLGQANSRYKDSMDKLARVLKKF